MIANVCLSVRGDSLVTYVSVCSVKRIMSTNEEVPQKGVKVQSFKQRRTFGELFSSLVVVAAAACFQTTLVCARVCLE